jgi:hypothetical protein
MKIALRTSALALVVALAATASATLQLPRAQAAHDHATCAVSDPDPSDCPFCGGNPTLHVRRMTDVEQTTMALYATMFR